jgi:hypothetical protein
MSSTKIDAFTRTNQGVIVSGTTEFQMMTNLSAQFNYTVPDFTKTIMGTLTLAEDTPVVEL